MIIGCGIIYSSYSQNSKQIIEHVKNHHLTDSLTVKCIIEALAGEGLISWQLFRPLKYINDENIIGVQASAESTDFIAKRSYTLQYIYHLEKKKVFFYSGFIDGEVAPEIKFIVEMEQINFFNKILK